MQNLEELDVEHKATPGKDRFTPIKLTLLAAAAALALALGFAVDTEVMLTMFSAFGYFIIAGSFAIFLFFLCSQLRQMVWTHSVRLPLAVIGAALALATFSGIHIDRGFNTIYDEEILAATAFQMHHERDSTSPTRGFFIDGRYETLDMIAEKRLLLFPFLLSLVHDLSGYRIENSFILNFSLGCVLYVLAFVWGNILAGRIGGFTAMILFFSYPLVWIEMSGGGLDLLNLVMILALGLAGWAHLRFNSATSLGLLIYSTVLLSNTRQESFLFGISALAFILLTTLRDRKIHIPWLACIAPLCFLCIPWQYYCSQLVRDIFQLESRGFSGQPIFSIGYLPENLSRSWNYYFSGAYGYAQPLILSWLTTIAVVLTPLWKWRTDPIWWKTPKAQMFIIIGLGTLAWFATMAAFLYGQFDRFTVHRYSLVLYPAFIFSTVLLVSSCAKKYRSTYPLFFTILLVNLFGFAIPSAARGDFTRVSFPQRVENWKLEFIKNISADERVLFIDEVPYLQILNKQACVIFDNLTKERIQKIRWHMDEGTFDRVIVYQRLNRDNAGKLFIRPEMTLPEYIELETLSEHDFKPYSRGRFSEVTRINIETPPYSSIYQSFGKDGPNHTLKTVDVLWKLTLP